MRGPGRPRGELKVVMCLRVKAKGNYLGRMIRMARRLGLTRGELLERWIDKAEKGGKV